MVMDFIPYSPLSDFTPQRLTLTAPINLSLNFRILRLWNLDSFPMWMSSYPSLTHFWIFRAGGDLNFCHIFQKENLLFPNLGWWLQSLKWGKWVGQGSHCSGFCELWKYQLSQVLKVRKVSGTPYLWIWVEFCVGWAPTVQTLVDPALLVCSDMLSEKMHIQESSSEIWWKKGGSKRLWAAFSLQVKAISTLPGAIPETVIMLLRIKGEACLYLTWCLGRWDVLSWEIVTLGWLPAHSYRRVQISPAVWSQ